MTIQEASCFRLHFLTQGGSSTNVLKTTGGPKKQLPVWGDDFWTRHDKKISKGLAEDSFLEYKKTGGKRLWDIFCYEVHPAIVSQSLTNQSCQAYMTYDKEKHANPCPSIASHILKSGNPMPHDPHLHEKNTSTRNWVKNLWPFPYKLTYHIPPMEKQKISSFQPPCRGYMFPIQASYP